MKRIILTLFIAVCVAIFSCSKEDTAGWEDTIQLSQKLVTVNAEASVTSITTGTDSWRLQSVTLDDGKFDLQGIDPAAKNFIVEARDFSVERKNGNEIIITMQANTNEEDRVLILGLQNGYYFDVFRVIQLGAE